MKNHSEFIVTDRGGVYEARPKNHTRLSAFGSTPGLAIKKLRYALRNGWDKHRNDVGAIFRETAAKEN